MAPLLLSLTFLSFLLLPPPSFAASSCASETFSKNRLYTTCNDLPHLSSSLHFSYDNSTGTLSLAFVSAPPSSSGWVAWALNPTGSGMIGSQALIAFKQSNGAMVVKTFNVSGYEAIQESPIAYKTSDLSAEFGSDGKIRMFAKVVVGQGASSLNQVWQVGGSVTNGVPDKHDFKSDNLASVGKLDLVKGVSTTDSSAATSSDNKRNVHGILNGVSWGILIPLGAIIARYVKVFEVADPAWFYMHVSCQLTGYAIGVAGWATGINLGKESKGITYTTHRSIGIAIFALATLQIFALFLRPNKDHKFRLFWNVYHHSVGYSVIVLGAINIFRGLTILQTGDKWRTAYIAVICVLVGIAIVLEALTWLIVLKRRRSVQKTYSNGHASVQQPFGV
ncbi:Cytochrome b561 and DOMON domain-containing protein [Rhynchospora pubera]|uniref:Cytochrome b561 and DOMON domain-containing protein n=1 Tax=Rhynchospora pubera TaxID=906938 RepID=A0AAV8EYR7_9POAL|nr:Cytochrome b561 and DOMON domain-containing protein [Rhynchospora pubera]